MRYLILFALFLSVSVVHGSDPSDVNKTEVVQNQMVVVKDAVTGEYRAPNPEEMQEIARQMNVSERVLKPVETIYHANGTVTARLNGRFLSYTIVKKNPDGTMKLDCVKTSKQLTDFLNKDQKEVPNDR